MLEIITNWLENRQRKYSDGLAIFSTLASEDEKTKYLTFFHQVEGEPAQHDIHFSMLVNKVSDIARNVRISPRIAEGKTLTLVPTEPDANAIAAKEIEISELKKTIETLKTDNEEILDGNSELNDQVEELESDLETAQGEVSEYEQKLEELEAQLTELKAKRGISIVAYDNLPEDIQKLYDRVKVITPMMASLHADISVDKLHHATRAKLVKQLLDLDDERRSCWDAIDSWSEGKTIEPVLEKPAYSDDKLVAGAQMVRRVLKLEENIKNSQKTVDTSDKEAIKQNAMKRIADYQTELAELQVQLKPVEDLKGDVE